MFLKNKNIPLQEQSNYPILANIVGLLTRSTYVFFLGCSPSVESIEVPVPPNIIEKAERFFEPTGSLNENDLDKINDWLLSDGGIAILGANTVLNYVLPNTLNSLNEGLGVESGDTGDGQSENIQIEDLGIEGDGWVRLTQPCGSEKKGNIVLSTLFSDNGFDPRFFGSATQCEYPDYDLQFSGELSFLLPLDVPLVDTSIWNREEVGSWMFFDGNLDIHGYELSSDFDVMLTEDLRSKILWNHDEKSFVVSIPNLQSIEMDLENFDLEELEKLQSLGIEIATEEGGWNCIFIERTCEGPNNQTLEWL